MKHVKVVYKHKKGCFVPNNESWSFEEVVFVHHKKFTRKWYIWICNNPACTAKLMVRENLINDFVQKLLKHQ